MKIGKSTSILIAAAVIFGGLAAFSANYSVSEAVSAIDAIGTLQYNDESLERFQQAVEVYDNLDEGQNLKTYVTNADTLEADRLTYARIMIKAAVQAYKQQDNAEEAIAAARDAVDTYVSSDDVWSIENYQDLLDLEEIYGQADDSGETDAETETEAAEEVPIC